MAATDRLAATRCFFEQCRLIRRFILTSQPLPATIRDKPVALLCALSYLVTFLGNSVIFQAAINAGCNQRMREPTELFNTNDSPRRRFLLPQFIRQQGAALMHQQCWLWGQDVKRPQENVLLDYGFTRHRAPETECTRGCTGYELLLPDGRAIVLWGFGLFLGDRDLGGMYVKRYGFSPRWLKESRLSLPIW